MEIKTIISELQGLLRLEEKAQEQKFFEQDTSLKELRNEGVIIHPIKIKNKTFGYNDQPVITVSYFIPDGLNSSFFSQGAPVSLFLSSSGEFCHGQLLSVSDKGAEVLLFSNDFSDWIDESDIGLKRLPDSRSFQMMHAVLKRIIKGENKGLTQLFEIVYGIREQESLDTVSDEIQANKRLNKYQINAINKGLQKEPVQLIHGPPGTGKTTTIVALIQELRKQKQSIIASAPSNAAIDHLAKQLIDKGLKVLRLGNTAKVNLEVWKHTPEGILSLEKHNKKIKKLKIQAAEYRKMAQQYKRNFGKEEREQRKLLYKEVYAIRDEIKALTNYYLTHYFEAADVVLGTPVGLMHPLLKDKKFDVAFLDEAGQCIAPFAWLVFEKADRIIMSGDHFQLPPTIISEEASKKGLSVSVLEQAIKTGIESCLLQIQYRMTPEIAGFSSRYFYKGKLETAASSQSGSLVFYDTAGAGFDEKRQENSRSLSNPEELRIIKENYKNWSDKGQSVVFISPYSGQVERAKEQLKDIEISTIDAFQGQEADVVIISLVRSNPEGKIGFLSDYRRMNVALTRAKLKLIVVGDSTTLAGDKFYEMFVKYTEEIGAYKSVFELMY